MKVAFDAAKREIFAKHTPAVAAMRERHQDGKRYTIKSSTDTIRSQATTLLEKRNACWRLATLLEERGAYVASLHFYELSVNFDAPKKAIALCNELEGIKDGNALEDAIREIEERKH